MDVQKQTAPAISTLSVLKVAAIILLLLFLWIVRDILAILFISLIFASAVDPWVDTMQRRRIPRILGILFIYVVLFGALSLIIYLLVPIIVEQISEISKNFPNYYEKVVTSFVNLRTYSESHGLDADVSRGIEQLNNKIAGNIGAIFSTISSFFGGIISFFLVLVMTFHIVVQESAIKKIVRQLAPDRYQPYLHQLINRIQIKVGSWLQGQLVLCLIIGVMTFVILSLAGVKYALVLALIAGFFEFIPYLGPLLGAIPAVFLTFFQSPVKALVVIGIYMIIQWTENNIIVPKVMQKAVGLNPIVSITVLLIGAKIGGVVGALLAIPVTTALSVVVKDFFEKKEEVEELKDI